MHGLNIFAAGCERLIISQIYALFETVGKNYPSVGGNYPTVGKAYPPSGNIIPSKFPDGFSISARRTGGVATTGDTLGISRPTMEMIDVTYIMSVL